MKNRALIRYKENQIVSIMLIISGGIHLLIGILIFTRVPSSPPVWPPPRKQQQLIPLKTVGIAKGQKLFSQKMVTGNTPIAKQTKDLPPPNVTLLPAAEIHKRQQEKLKKLSPSLNMPLKSLVTSPVHKKAKQQKNVISVRQAQQIQKIKQQTLQAMSPTIRNSPAIQKSGFYFKFVPPQGIPEDELNSIEKIFYSFQKRTYHSYVTSLISQYYKMLTEKPYIEKTLFTRNERLSGRISIDPDGNITRVRFIQTSQSNEIQELFEKTLLGIRNLPNPPKELLKGGDELNIYFQLIITN